MWSKHLIGTVDFMDESNRRFKLNYYLHFHTPNPKTEICIEKISYSEMFEKESASVCCFGILQKDVHDFAVRLFKNGVTPILLQDVFEDFIFETKVFNRQLDHLSVS